MKRWLGVCLMLWLLCISVSAIAEQAEQVIDAADGANLTERLQTISYSAGDILRLRGRFASADTVFPRQVHLALEEGAEVYGNLIFEEGGTLSGDGEEATQLHGSVRAGEACELTLLAIRIEGSVWVGDPQADSAQSKGRLVIVGRVLVVSLEEQTVFSVADLEIGTEASLLAVAAAEQGMAIKVGRDVRVRELGSITAWTQSWGYASVSAGRDVLLEDSSFMEARAGSDSQGVSAGRAVILGTEARFIASAYDTYGAGIFAGSLQTASDSVIDVRDAANGIVLLPIGVDCLRIDPTTIVDASTLLFVSDYDLASPVTFFYTEKPPVLKLENDYGAVIGHPENYQPIKWVDP